METTSHTVHATAIARGYLARKRVAEMRRTKEEAARADPKVALLRHRVAKVSAASRVVASCLVANAANRRRQRRSEARDAVAMVRGRGLRGKVAQCSAAKRN